MFSFSRIFLESLSTQFTDGGDTTLGEECVYFFCFVDVVHILRLYMFQKVLGWIYTNVFHE